MLKPNVSVVASVRERVGLLDKMLESLFATASDSSGVEVVLRCDNDDAKMIEYLRGRHVLFIVGQRLDGYRTLGALVNEAARLSHADLVLVVNDDAEFVTKGWDELLCRTADRYPDGVYDLGVDTVLNAANFVFPCTSRRMIDLIGIHRDDLVYNDIWLRDVMLPFGRAIHVPEVTIRHNWEGMTDDQARAVRTMDAAYNELYARRVAEAREKVSGVLNCVGAIQ